MSIFKKLFGGASSQEENQQESSPFLEETTNLPVDELFMTKFVKNGGKFLYCENFEELKSQLENILEENDWFEREVLCFDASLNSLLLENNLIIDGVKDPAFMFLGCENLIAEDGSVLFSSKQIKHYKPADLPANMIVFASTSQLVLTKSDGLRRIKSKYRSDLPTNITGFKYFEKAKDESFLNYGSVHKNLYLLLLEDL